MKKFSAVIFAIAAFEPPPSFSIFVVTPLSRRAAEEDRQSTQSGMRTDDGGELPDKHFVSGKLLLYQFFQVFGVVATNRLHDIHGVAGL